MAKYVFLVTILFCSIKIFSHPLHIAITNIDFKNGSVEVNIRFFEDDLKNIMVQEGLINESTQWTDTSSQIGIALQLFVRKYLHIKAESSVLELTCAEHKLDGLSLLIKFTSKTENNSIKTIEITNLLMTKYFNDQLNLMIINVMGIEKGFQLDSQKTTETIYL